MAAKINDGLFIGDAETSQDPEFLELNKISNLVNLAGHDVSNVWAAHGLVYLTYYWEDRPDYVLFPEQYESISDLVEFIDTSLKYGVSVLLFSKRGTGRCAVAVCAYLMYKYRWGFEKTCDFVYSKKNDIDLNKGFIQQLFALDKSIRSYRHQMLKKQGADLPSVAMIESMRWKDWDPTYLQLDMTKLSDDDKRNASARMRRDKFIEIEENSNQDDDGDVIEETPEDELVLIHSYLNSKQTISELPGPFPSAMEVPKAFSLRFDGQIQEEDIHMLPTEPPKGASAVPKKGVIKGSFKYPAFCSTAKHSLAGPTILDSADSISNRRNIGSSRIPQPQRADPQTIIIEVKDDDGRRHPRDRVRESYEDKYANGLTQGESIARDNPGVGGPLADPKGRRFHDKIGVDSSPIVEASSDLYSYMGLGEVPRVDHSQSNGKNRLNMSNDNSSAVVSAEDRLRSLVDDMEGRGSVRAGKGRTARAQDQNPANTDDMPSLHDLANMHISGNDAGEREDPLAAFESLQRTGGAIRVRRDFVAESKDEWIGNGPPQSNQYKSAWDSSGAVGASIDQKDSSRSNPSMIPQRSGQTRSNPNSIPQAYVQRLQATIGVYNSATQSGTPTKPSARRNDTENGLTQEQRATPKVYRHGSPAPRGNVQNKPASNRPGTFGASTRMAWGGSSDQNQPRTLNRNGANQGSNMSINSIGSDTTTQSQSQRRRSSVDNKDSAYTRPSSAQRAYVSSLERAFPLTIQLVGQRERFSSPSRGPAGNDFDSSSNPNPTGRRSRAQSPAGARDGSRSSTPPRATWRF